MVCADLWMWGIEDDKYNKKGAWTTEKIQSRPLFQEERSDRSGNGGELDFIDLTNSTCWNLMPWPSKVCNGTEDNVLKALIGALHGEGFKVVTETLHNFTPFETIKWHYPCEEPAAIPR